jgi:hypothetical protein
MSEAIAPPPSRELFLPLGPGSGSAIMPFFRTFDHQQKHALAIPSMSQAEIGRADLFGMRWLLPA